MSNKAGPGAGPRTASLNLGRQVDAAIDVLARRRAGLSGAGPRPGLGRPGLGHGGYPSSFARPGFGNFARHELGSFGRASFLGQLVPASVKPVPVILGTVVGVGFNSAASRVLESPKVGINANPLLARVLLAGGGVLLHVLAKTDFTLGFMVGQFPGLIDAGVTALMDMVMGESPAVAGLHGQDLAGVSREALAELQALRRRLESPAPMAEAQGAQAQQLPMAVRAQAA